MQIADTLPPRKDVVSAVKSVPRKYVSLKNRETTTMSEDICAAGARMQGNNPCLWGYRYPALTQR